MKVEFLADHPVAIARVARWYFNEWGPLIDGDSVEQAAARLRTYLNTDKLPFILIGMEDSEVLGAVQLKYRELAELFPEKEHWLGGVYVDAAHRGKSVAVRLIDRLIELAPAFGVKQLYLQTEHLDGGLYRRLGWLPVEQIRHRGIEVLIMVRSLEG